MNALLELPELDEIIERLGRIERKLDKLEDARPTKVYDLKRAAEILGVAYGTVREMCITGKLRYSTRGKGAERTHYLVTEDAIEDYLKGVV